VAVASLSEEIRLHAYVCALRTLRSQSISASFAWAKFSSFPLCIAAEIFCKPPLCLSAVAGTELHDCRCIVSDAALLQANEALILEMEAQCGEPIIRQAAWDRAGACIPVQEQCSHGVAVLATTQAARSAGLHILVDGIHDADADVNARFLILGRIGCAMISPCPRAASRIRAERKTTLLASVHNEPECLSSILRVFADAGVAVLAIQTRLLAPWSTSRYVHSRAFCRRSYRYLTALICSFQVHQIIVSFVSTESRPSTLLEQLGERTVSQRVFGTYFSMAAAPSTDSVVVKSTPASNATATSAPSNNAAAAGVGA
jgi:hypothetical protein